MVLSNSVVVIMTLAFLVLMSVSLVTSMELVSMRGAVLLLGLGAAASYFIYTFMVSTVPELFSVISPVLTSFF